MKEMTDLLFAFGIALNAILAALTYIRTVKSANTILLLEQNTNSIKDALVKVTGESEHAKGMLQGKADEKEAKQRRSEK